MKLVILDRDGVINVDSAKFIKNPSEWKPIPGSLEAIARLNHMGYRVVIASNQSGVGRGLFDMGTLNAINDLDDATNISIDGVSGAFTLVTVMGNVFVNASYDPGYDATPPFLGVAGWGLAASAGGRDLGWQVGLSPMFRRRGAVGW